MAGLWTVEIGGVSRPYNYVNFERMLKKGRPSTISLTVKNESDIDYFDLIEIKRDTVVEWKGFIMTKNKFWDGNGLYLDITGANTDMIIWKKYSEGFSNMHEDTKGFFGLVSAEELIKFIFRNPTSDPVGEYPFNKEGWGMDKTRFGECSARRTSSGDPNWVKLRRRGYGWRNKGTPFNSEVPDVDAISVHAWNETGASPWINTSNEANYIYSNTIDETDIFTFENLTALDASASGINTCDVAVKWKPRHSIWAGEKSDCEIWISPEAVGPNWSYVGSIRGWTWLLNPNPWRIFTFDASNIITTVGEANAARVKFVNKAEHKVYICWCYLAINYSTNGDQETDDYFDIPFEYDEIMGVYVESRFDNESYPVDYRIYKVANELQDYVTNYTELDVSGDIDVPTSNMNADANAGQKDVVVVNGALFTVGWSVIIRDDTHYEENVIDSIAVNTLTMERNLKYDYTTAANGKVNAVHIDFDASLDAGDDAFLSKSFGADYFGDFFKHTVLIKPIGAIPDPPVAGGDPDGIILGFWCIANEVDDLKALVSGNKNHISLSIWRDPLNVIEGGNPCIRLGDQDGAVGTIDYSLPITVGSVYTCEIVRSEGTITVVIAEDGVEFNTITVAMNDATNKFEYLFGCMSADQGRAQTCDVDIYELILETETALISEVTSNTFRDIIHSWEPQEMDTIRIRITGQTTGRAWTISQVYVYPSIGFELRTYRDNVTTTLLTGDAASGQKIVATTNSDSYGVGDIVTIKDNNNQEVNQVASKAGLNVTMENNLEYTYETAESAELIKGFPEEQYIGAFSFDTSYTTPIGPFNLPRGRLIDQLNVIMQKCHAAYIPYEWWLALDALNTFHMDSQRGSDLSTTVSFIKGFNLGGAREITGIVDTIQRLKLLGEGEGKRQEKVSSSWVEDKPNMVVINTFFEDIISDKSVVDMTIADIIANIHVTEEAPPNTQMILNVNNDPYPSMNYDVGDIVTVTDSLTGISGAKRVYNIKKKIIPKEGEKITIVVNSPLLDDEDEWHEIYKRLKMLEISEAIAGDWTGEANDENKISSEDAVTDSFEAKAKNDTIEEVKGVRDPRWNYAPVPPDFYNPLVDHQVGAGTAVAEYYDWNATLNNMTFHHTDKKMGFWGPDNGAGSQTLMIELAGEANDRIDVPLDKNPKLTAELKFVWATGVAPTDWNVGDIFEIGLYDLTTSIGYFIRFTKEAGHTLLAEAVWNETGSDEQTQTIMSVLASDENVLENYRYKIEIIVNTDEKLVFFNIYDLRFGEQKYPTSVIKLDIDTQNIVRPLYMAMTADNTGAGGTVVAKANIYYFKTEWERVMK